MARCLRVEACVNLDQIDQGGVGSEFSKKIDRFNCKVSILLLHEIVGQRAEALANLRDDAIALHT